MKKPTHSQILAAKVRAAVDAYVKKHRKPHMGGYLVPNRDTIYSAVSKKLGVRKEAISVCMSYSRYCDHPWSRGACSECPPAEHIPW